MPRASCRRKIRRGFFLCLYVCAYVLKSILKTTGDEPVAHRTVDYSRNEFSLSLIVIAFPPAKGGLM